MMFEMGGVVRRNETGCSSKSDEEEERSGEGLFELTAREKERVVKDGSEGRRGGEDEMCEREI